LPIVWSLSSTGKALLGCSRRQKVFAGSILFTAAKVLAACARFELPLGRRCTACARRVATTGCWTSAPRSKPSWLACGGCDGVESRVLTEAASDPSETRDQELMLSGVEPFKRCRLGALGKPDASSRSRPRWYRASGEPCRELASLMKMSEPEPDIGRRLTAGVRRPATRVAGVRG
jgi:hypothetical protein